MGGAGTIMYFNGRRLDHEVLTLEKVGGRSCCGAYTAYKVEELDEPGRLYLQFDDSSLELDVFQSNKGIIIGAPKNTILCTCMEMNYEEKFKAFYGIK